MILVLHDIPCSLDEGIVAAPGHALKRLRLSPDTPATLAKASVDARGKAIQFVASVAIELDEACARALKEAFPDYKITLREATMLDLPTGHSPLSNRPVVAGFGPAGMFAALILARQGYRPIVIERGSDIDSRQLKVQDFWQTGRLDPETNVQFGEGGAGAFSDGKLTTRIGDPRCEWILREFVHFGAPDDILYKSKPHVGTDKLVRVVRALREEIIRLGGEVRFNTKLIGLDIKSGRLAFVRTSAGEIPAQAAILAPGHSARDSFDMLDSSGLTLLPKPFSVGVRVEHLQADIDHALYGAQAGHPNLWPGEYQLSHREGEEACYTFCMCPGGQVVAAASDTGQVVTNGMSHYARDLSNANSALVVSVSPAGRDGGWRDNVAFQQALESRAMLLGSGRAPAQSVGLFLEGKGGIHPGRVKPTYPHGILECHFDELFSPAVTAMMRRALPIFGRRMRGFDAADTLLTGVESRTSSPLRIARDEALTAIGIDGLYPCGEGAGYAGGIMSAAVDGLKVASALMAHCGRPAGDGCD